MFFLPRASLLFCGFGVFGVFSVVCFEFWLCMAVQVIAWNDLSPK